MSLKKAALSFEKLLNIEYKIILGKRGKKTEFLIGFNKENFFHLVGLQKLKDINYPTENKEKIFDYIIEGKIEENTLSKSSKFEEIKLERIIPFIRIEEIIDNDNLVFKFNKNNVNWTSIGYKFILENKSLRNPIYLFIDGNYEKGEKLFCRSFFAKADKDYTFGNTRMTMLHKEKINTLTGESIIQFSKIKK